MIRHTSREALKDLKIEPLEKEILNCVIRNRSMTRREISVETGLDTSTVAGRVNRLVQWGVLDEASKRNCRITGRMVWALSA